MPPDIVAARRKLVAEEGRGIFMPTPPPTAFGIPKGHSLTDWVRRRITPHPATTYESGLKLEHPLGNGRSRTYVVCTNPLHPPTAGAREWVAKQDGWAWQELATGHDAIILAPTEVALLLSAVG